MKNSIIITLFLLLNLSVFSQQAVPCGAITERVPIPSQYSTKGQLPPDPCNALSSYGTEKVLTVSTQPDYLEIQKRIRVVVETTIDPDNCTSVANEVSRDTFVVGEQKVYAASKTPVGGYWTVRMELMVYAPQSRPVGCYATRLPQSANSKPYKDGNTIALKDYWVVHSGEYQTQAEATAATKALKKLHPEFCRAYAYLLPIGCNMQYTYKNVKE